MVKAMTSVSIASYFTWLKKETSTINVLDLEINYTMDA
jgi:hypothetical protein